jgi:integrase
MPKRLTAAAIARLKPGPKRRAVADGRGLYIVVQPKTGSKSWHMHFRGVSGKMDTLVLGPYDDSGEEVRADPVIGTPLTLAGARRLAAEVNRQRALGEDVVAQRLRDKAEREAVAANTFTAAARDFISDHSMQKVRGWREQAKLLGLDAELNEIRGGLSERWRDKPISTIDGHDIHRVIEEVRRRGVPGMGRHNDGVSEARARHMFSCLSRMSSWLVEQRRIESNPCAGVKRPDTPRARERVLTDGEVVKFWRATDRLGPPFGSVLRLLLVTGQRLNEVAGLRWSEVVGLNFEEVQLPPARTKNHRAHVVPLSRLAREIVAAVKPFPGGSDYVFTTTGTTPISGWSKTKRRLDNLMGDVPPWRLHDLRRTFAVGAARAGADLAVIERALNHISGSFGGIVGVYQQYQYRDEVRAAMKAWADLLMRIVK